MAEYIEMVADRLFRGSPHEGRLIRPGDRFQATPRRARLHELAGRAHRVSENAPSPNGENGRSASSEENAEGADQTPEADA